MGFQMGGKLRDRETAKTDSTGQNRRRTITPIRAQRGSDGIQSPAIFMPQRLVGSQRAESGKLAEASETPKQLPAFSELEPWVSIRKMAFLKAIFVHLIDAHGRIDGKY